ARRLRDERPDAAQRAIGEKGGAELIPKILAREVERRRRLKDVQDLKAQRNTAPEAIGRAKKAGQDAAAEQARMREVGDRIKALDAELKTVDEAIEALLVQVPNLPHPSVPPGKSDEENVEVRRWGTPRRFDFPPRPHEDAAPGLGLLDMDRAAKLAKPPFALRSGPLPRPGRPLAQL